MDHLKIYHHDHLIMGSILHHTFNTNLHRSTLTRRHLYIRARRRRIADRTLLSLITPTSLNTIRLSKACTPLTRRKVRLTTRLSTLAKLMAKDRRSILVLTRMDSIRLSSSSHSCNNVDQRSIRLSPERILLANDLVGPLLILRLVRIRLLWTVLGQWSGHLVLLKHLFSRTVVLV
jgi:hypothetical protein